MIDGNETEINLLKSEYKESIEAVPKLLEEVAEKEVKERLAFRPPCTYATHRAEMIKELGRSDPHNGKDAHASVRQSTTTT